MWFERLTGFEERTTPDVRSQFEVDGEWITSRANGRRMRVGRFEMAALADLRSRRRPHWTGHALRFDQVVADARALTAEPSSAGATFQVASQFNMLEMVGPEVTPEQGVDGYEHDHTQGPASAIACGAGTIYRNYLVPVDGDVGQTASRQLNGLGALTEALGVDVDVRNGYALPTEAQLSAINTRLEGADERTRDRLMGHLRVGVQWNTEVTVGDGGHVVTQVYCSALPIAYDRHPTHLWEPLARLVLDAAYEATLAVAVINAEATGNGHVFLTLLGGGAFGNPVEWILASIQRAMRVYTSASLDVRVVSYGSRRAEVDRLDEPGSTWAHALFEQGPHQWGLRGDPYLWVELREMLAAHPKPRSSSELEGLLVSGWNHLTGVDVATTTDEAVRVERYPTSGMSGGFVHPVTWRERLIPMLVERLDHA
jgi:hypothetical protein